MSLNAKVTSAVLVRLNAGSDERLISLGRPLTVVGSKGHARLRLLSSDVSGSHAVLLNIANNYFIRDLMSRGGVLLNEQPVREARLKYGDVIGVGNFRFRFEDAGLLRQPPLQFRAPPGALHLPGQIEPLRLDSMLFVIGRQEGANLVLKGSLVSKAHALVFEHQGQRLIRDLASRHGTFVNGEQIHEVVLRDGDLIQIGNVQFRYAELDISEESQNGAAGSHALKELEPVLSTNVADEHVATLNSGDVNIVEHRILPDLDSDEPPLRLESQSENAFPTEAADYEDDDGIRDEDSEPAWVLEEPDVAESSERAGSGTIDDVRDLASWAVVTGTNPLLADSANDSGSGLILRSDRSEDERPQSALPAEGADETVSEAVQHAEVEASPAQQKPPVIEVRSAPDANDNIFLQPADSLAALVRPKETTKSTRLASAQAADTAPTSPARPQVESRRPRPMPCKLKDSEELAAILGPGILALSGGHTLDEERPSNPRSPGPPRSRGRGAAITAATLLGTLSLIAAGAWLYLRRH
jgi:pSer/pThr/pTyr-binding forkhead associated (FHA) protein